MIVPMVLTSNHSLNFPSQISLNHILDLPLSPCGDINPELGEKIDGPRSHSTCDHHVCFLRMDELRDDTRLMVGKVRIFHHLKSRNLIVRHINKDIERTSAKVRA